MKNLQSNFCVFSLILLLEIRPFPWSCSYSSRKAGEVQEEREYKKGKQLCHCLISSK